jgi:hypothetical protein
VRNQTEPVATDTDAVQEYQQNHLYKEEQLSLEIDIIAHQKEIARLQHEYDSQDLNAAYNSLSDSIDGVNIYARTDGIIADIKKNEGDKVSNGDEILSIGYKKNDKLLVKMVGNKDKGSTELETAKLGQTITFTSSDKTYTGSCIGTCGDDEKFYLSTIDGVVYETVSKSLSDSAVQFYADVDDEKFYTDMPDVTVSFQSISLSGVIALPKAMIYTEHDKAKNMDFSYVWKLEDGQFIKQYVVTDAKFSNDEKAVVLSGVKEGDILASEEND